MTQASRAALSNLLRESTVALEVEGRLGTGFFVAPGLVLTCGHVVAGRNERLPDVVVGGWAGEELRLAVVPASFRPDQDLALLRTETAVDHPSVSCNPAVAPGDDLWTYGYPDGRYRAGESAAFDAIGDSVRGFDERLIRVTQKARVGPGFSGAPVLNWRTGGVCGMLRLADSRSDSGASGARLIPVETILEEFPQLGTAARSRTRAWVTHLTDNQLAAGAWTYPGATLRAYLEATCAASREHPYTLAIPALPQLGTVYLRQQAAATGELTGLDEADAAARNLVTGARLEADTILDWHPNARIVGSPGSGKSSLLRILAERAAQSLLDGMAVAKGDGLGGAYVPVYLHASALTGGAWSECLSTAVSQSLSARLDRSLKPELFDAMPLQDVPWLLLVDGIDEVLDPRARDRLYRDIAVRLKDKRYRFLLASRPLSDLGLAQHLEDLTVYEIQPFSESELPGFAGTWFKALRMVDADLLVDQFIQQIRGGRLRELARTPLLATMLCALFVRNPIHRLPVARAHIYRDFLGLLLNKGPDEIDTQRQIYGRALRLGRAAADAADTLFSRTRLLLQQLADSRTEESRSMLDEAARLTEDIRPDSVALEKWIPILADVLRHTGVVVDRGGEFAFTHETMREYLAATYQVSRMAHQELADQIIEKVTDGSDLDLIQSLLLFQVSALGETGYDMDEVAREILATQGWHTVFFVSEMLLDRIPLNASIRSHVTDLLLRVSRSADLSRSVYNPIDAAAQLALLEPEMGLSALRNVLSNSEVTVYRRIQAANRLCEFGRNEGMNALAKLAADRATEARDRIEAAETLLRWNKSAGLNALASIYHDDWLRMFVRLDVADRIAQTDSTRAIHHLARTIRDPTLPPYDRVDAARLAARIDEGSGVRLLDSLVQDAALPEGPRVSAIYSLASGAPNHAAASLSALAAQTTASGRIRLEAARYLLGVDQAAGAAAMIALAQERGVRTTVRLEAANQCLTFDPPTGSRLLLGIAADESVRPLTRVNALKVILCVDPPSALRHLSAFTDPHKFAAHVRIEAAKAIGEVDPVEARAVLTGIVPDLSLHDEDRQRATQALRQISPEDR